MLPLKPGPPGAGPSNKLFLPNQNETDTQNLLQSPDDVFSSPPVYNTSKERDLFGSEPFVVGGVRNENGDPVFLYANQHSVDVVKLSPPIHTSLRKKVIFNNPIYFTAVWFIIFFVERRRYSRSDKVRFFFGY